MNRIVWILFIICLNVYSYGQSLDPVLTSALNRTLDSMKNVLGIKSLSAALENKDAVTWAHATGISSSIPLVEVTPNDTYLIGSVTKTITAAYILKLEEQGLLSLNDTIGKYLPILPHIKPNITVKQLLQHTSGLYDVLANPQQQPTILQNVNKIWRPEEIIRTFIKAPNFAPGVKWDYSNTNYFLLDMIIEKVTGKPFYEQYRKTFLEPLEMNSFGVPALEPFMQPVAHVWIDLDGNGVLDDAHNFYFGWKSLNSTAGAAGGYYGTAAHTARWIRRYQRGDMHVMQSIAKSRNFISASGSQGGLYGLGLMSRMFSGRRGYGHGGDLAYSASAWYFPDLDLGISVLGNDQNFNSWQLLNVVDALIKTYNKYLLSPVEDAQGITIKLYPNPVADELILACDDCSPVKSAVVVDQWGKESVITVRDGRLDIASLASGAYILRIQLGGREASQLFVKL
jgi:D-alanyl-D-alanine carboxypeptidase